MSNTTRATGAANTIQTTLLKRRTLNNKAAVANGPLVTPPNTARATPETTNPIQTTNPTQTTLVKRRTLNNKAVVTGFPLAKTPNTDRRATGEGNAIWATWMPNHHLLDNYSIQEAGCPVLELLDTAQAGDPGQIRRKSIPKQRLLNSATTKPAMVMKAAILVMSDMMVEPAMVVKPAIVVVKSAMLTKATMVVRPAMVVKPVMLLKPAPRTQGNLLLPQ